MNIINLILGVLLVLEGRKLFWLFVGGMGFALSLSLALQIFKGQPLWMLTLIALAIGVAGALLTIFVQKAAVIFGGFLAGAYLLGSLSSGLHLSNQLNWLPYLLGGILGGALVAVLFEWSLIILSSLVGALLVVQAINLSPGLEALAVLLIFLAGAGVQAAGLRREGHPQTEH
jgi:hypothetical protein